MTKFNSDLYPPVTLPAFPPTWDDIERLARHYPVAHDAVTMVQRGDWTREQALIMLTFALAAAFQKLFSDAVERRMTQITPPFVFPAPSSTGDK